MLQLQLILYPLTLYGVYDKNNGVEPHFVSQRILLPFNKMSCDSAVWNRFFLSTPKHLKCVATRRILLSRQQKELQIDAVCYPANKMRCDSTHSVTPVNKMHCDSTHFVTCSQNALQLQRILMTELVSFIPYISENRHEHLRNKPNKTNSCYQRKKIVSPTPSPAPLPHNFVPLLPR